MSDVDRIVKMLEEGTAELQCAAAMVLGELGSPAAHKALLSALKAENETLRLYAVEALGKINAKEAAPHLVPLLINPRLKARIQQVLLSIGPEAVPLLQKHIEEADADARSAILEVLGQFKSVDLSETMFDALLDKDLDVVRQAAEGLRARYAGMPPEGRAKAAKQVGAFLGRKLVPAAQAAGLRLLRELKDPTSLRTLLGFLDPKLDSGVRTAALDALDGMELGKEMDRVVPKLLLALESEPLVSSAVRVLSKVKLGKDQADRVLKLLDSRNAAVRLFAIQALGAMGGARAAEGLVQGLFNPDRRIADEAQRALQGNADFAPALIKALEAEEEVGRAFTISRVLRAHRESVDASTMKRFLERFLRLHEKRSATFKVYYEILRGVATAQLREAIVKRGRELMKKRKYDEAERLLQLVLGEDIATGESDFALAEALLVTLRKDIATARLDRSQSAVLFSKLVRRAEFPVLKELEKDASMLGSDSLLYLGFVMVERQGAEREFGAAVLRLVAKKFARSKDGETAKAKLKTQGAV